MIFIVFAICWILNELEAPWWIWVMTIIGYAAKIAINIYRDKRIDYAIKAAVNLYRMR